MPFTAEYASIEPSRAEIDSSAGPLIVEFGAPWCGHCLGIQATLAQLLSEHQEVQHLKVHDGKGQPLGRSFRVTLWPTLVFLRDGKVLERLVRPGADAIERALQRQSGGER